MTEQALTGLRVIDVSTVVAGAMASSMLADHGAEVLKIEDPRTPDAARGLEPCKDGLSLWHKVAGRNKKALTLNLSRPQGGELLKRLIVDTDILIENFRPGTLERWGLGWDVLRAVNPALILVRISGYGQDGPYSGRPGFGTAAEAMSGLPMRSGFPDGPPALTSIPLADNFAGVFAALAAMQGVYSRDHVTGKGQTIDIGLYEPLLRIMEDQVIGYDQLGRIPERLGNRTPGAAPRGSFQTKDQKWVAVSAMSDKPVQRLLNCVGGQSLAADERFKTNGDRLRNVDALEQAIADWVGERPLKEVLEAFAANDVVAAPLLDITQIFEDPHIRHRANIIAMEDPDLGLVRVPGVVPKFDATPGAVQFLSVARGCHNGEIYGERLGLGAEELAALRKDGVI